MKTMITAQKLCKKYGKFKAVDRLSFEINQGECFGFLGPNGAGKTSTVRMIHCVSPLSGGTLTVDGMAAGVDNRSIKKMTGVIPQEITLDNDLTVRENLEVFAHFFDIPGAEARKRIASLLKFVELEKWRDSKIDQLSTGMKRRLLVARSLLNQPKIIIADEPTTGLDPQARHVLWDRLFRLKREGVTLVVTTHYMDEAEQLCDRLVVMDSGRIVAEGSPRQLIAQYSTREVLELRFDSDDHADHLDSVDGLTDRAEVLPDRLLLYTDDGEAAHAEVIRRGLDPMSALVRRSTLEDVFLHLTGRTLVD
jgi:lipooligosaccharide transport system ATP-binding protein